MTFTDLPDNLRPCVEDVKKGDLTAISALADILAEQGNARHIAAVLTSLVKVKASIYLDWSLWDYRRRLPPSQYALVRRALLICISHLRDEEKINYIDITFRYLCLRSATEVIRWRGMGPRRLEALCFHLGSLGLHLRGATVQTIMSGDAFNPRQNRRSSENDS